MINNKFITIFPRLIQEASKSQIKCQLAAALIKGQKLLSKPCSNALRNVCRGFACGSLHAEAHAILDYFGRDLSYSSKNGGSFYIPKDKKIKCDLIVIRINKDEKICTSRPCYNCLNMMKAVGIRKVYYTDNDEKIICENVKDMISINASSVTRLIHRLRTDKNHSDIDFFENLLRTLFPDKIKKTNLEYFLQYDLSNVLPKHQWFIGENKIIIILNRENKEIVKSKIID
jgi:deoxycytidylate deaminase